VASRARLVSWASVATIALSYSQGQVATTRLPWWT
jgi:hypothetical protein